MVIIPLPQNTTTLAMAEFHGINSQTTSIYTDALTSPASLTGSPAKQKQLTQTTEPTNEQAKQIRQSRQPTKEQISLLKPKYRLDHIRSITRNITKNTTNKDKTNVLYITYDYISEYR